MSIILLIVFYFIGTFITVTTLISVCICIFFAIPTTLKLETSGLLKEKNHIVVKYLATITILLSVFSGVTYLVLSHASALSIKGYFIGSIMWLIIGLRQAGRNHNNIRDYVDTQSKHFTISREDMEELLLHKQIK